MSRLIPYTHKEVVEIAYKWLLKTCGVGFAFKELKSTDSEIPDVIGFDSGISILIEVKVSRSDFLSDHKKPHRQKGMGNWRFYCCPKGLIKVNELPPKWGLIYVNDDGKARIEYDCRKKMVTQPIGAEWQKRLSTDGLNWSRIVYADENYFDADIGAERRIMYTALRRMQIKGHLKSIYDKDYNYNSKNE